MTEAEDRMMVVRAEMFASERDCGDGEAPCIRCLVQFAREEAELTAREVMERAELLQAAKVVISRSEFLPVQTPGFVDALSYLRATVTLAEEWVRPTLS